MTQIPSLTVAAAGPAGAELLAVGCFQDQPPEVDRLPEALRRAVQQVASRPGWRGREEQCGQTSVVPVAGQAAADSSRRSSPSSSSNPGGPPIPGIPAIPSIPSIVTLYGLGPAPELSFAKLERWLLRVAEDARQGGVHRLAIGLPAHEQTTGPAAARRIARAAALGGYRFEQFRTDTENGRLESVELLPPAGAEADYREQLQAAVKVAAAVSYARDLANMPGNAAHPAWMEEQARELAASHGMEITVLDVAELGRRRMGGLLAVGAGSAYPPRLLRLSWGENAGTARRHGAGAKTPNGASGSKVRKGAQGGGPAGAARPVIALVGKGITFDTGGISIKPAADMEQMKFDKCGACAVLGAMRAVADLGLEVPVRAYLPVAENMLGGAAYRPGDIVRCYNGKTVEITNTDAEGRMILADALSWAAEEGASSLVELSTLTGACVVALGHLAAGLFSPDDGLAAELAAAAAASGERLWRLPMLPEFLDEMKSLHADLRNSAGRWGGASTAAAFLSQFTGGLRRWAHLDIAGVAYASSEDGRGTAATGFGVASLVDWLGRREP